EVLARVGTPVQERPQGGEADRDRPEDDRRQAEGRRPRHSPANRPPYLKGYPPSSARSDTNYFSRRPLCLTDGPPLSRVLRGTARGRGVGLPGLQVHAAGTDDREIRSRPHGARPRV